MLVQRLVLFSVEIVGVLGGGLELLEVLKGRFHLETFLEIKEGSVLESTVANQVVKLVSRLDDVQVENVVESDDIFLFENSNVAIDV